MSDRDHDCATRTVMLFGNIGPRFRLIVIVFCVFLTVAVLLSMAITQSGTFWTDNNGTINFLQLPLFATPLLQFLFVAGIVGFVPLGLCIAYVCSLEARLLQQDAARSRLLRV
jgi:hypothetical protein